MYVVIEIQDVDWRIMGYQYICVNRYFHYSLYIYICDTIVHKHWNAMKFYSVYGYR